MAENIFLRITDYLLKPETWYEYSALQIDGYRMIASKEDQRQAGSFEVTPRATERIRQFGSSPITPYRDYYGKFLLQTRLVPEQLEVKFAIGYTIHSKLVTVDDFSKFSWLRLCTGMDQVLYPNLADQKQLLDYFLKSSKKPRLVITRVYQYFQFDLYQFLTKQIVQQESGNIIGK